MFSGSFESVHFILKTVLLIQSGQFTYILQSVLDDHHFETNIIASDSISVHLISCNSTLNPPDTLTLTVNMSKLSFRSHERDMIGRWWVMEWVIELLFYNTWLKVETPQSDDGIVCTKAVVTFCVLCSKLYWVLGSLPSSPAVYNDKLKSILWWGQTSFGRLHFHE